MEVGWGGEQCRIKMLMEYLTRRPDERRVEVKEGFLEEVAIEVRSEGIMKDVMGVVEMGVICSKTTGGRGWGSHDQTTEENCVGVPPMSLLEFEACRETTVGPE